MRLCVMVYCIVNLLLWVIGFWWSIVRWKVSLNNICKKANSTLGFLRRNLKNCPHECQKLAYTTLVHSILEYGSSVWDPHLQKDIDSLEKIQRQAARFILNDYKSRDDGCVTRMLQDLDLPTLQHRREFNRVVYLYKIVGVWYRQ